MESPWKVYTIMKHTRVAEKWVWPWPVRVIMTMMRRKKAEPLSDKEVKVHLVRVVLTSKATKNINTHNALYSCAPE